MLNFANPGVWVWQVVNCDYNRIKAFANAGFTWVAIQVCSGTEPVVTGNYDDLIQSARSLGLDVAAFGWLVDDPVGEAEMADRMLHSWGLDGFIANGEKPLEYSQDSGPCPDCFNYSDAWVERWRELRGMGTPLAFSSYCDFSRHDIHYQPWIEAGARAMPQTYWNEFDWATPECGVAGALDVQQPWNSPPYGWPVEQINATFGNYQSGSRPIPSPDAYAASLLRTSARGFNVYLGELMTEQDFSDWKRLIPSLTARALPPLTEQELPYSGPHYGPSDTRGPDKCKTAKALKRALYRLGVDTSFANPDEHYNAKLEGAMGRWQATRSISATGQYGKGSWDAMRGEIAPDGTHAMDEQCRAWIKEEVGGAV